MKKIIAAIAMTLLLVGSGGALAQSDDGKNKKDMYKEPQTDVFENMPQRGFPMPYTPYDGPGDVEYSGYGRMGSGMMGDCGWGARGMIGRMGGDSYHSPEKMREFMDKTKDMRRQLHDLRFEYGEKRRNPETTVGELEEMRQQMYELHAKIMKEAHPDTGASTMKGGKKQ